MQKVLLDLYEFCSKNHVEFDYSTEGEKNSIEFSKEGRNKLMVCLCDLEDKDFIKSMENKLGELNQLFQ